MHVRNKIFVSFASFDVETTFLKGRSVPKAPNSDHSISYHMRKEQFLKRPGYQQNDAIILISTESPMSKTISYLDKRSEPGCLERLNADRWPVLFGEGMYAKHIYHIYYCALPRPSLGTSATDWSVLPHRNAWSVSIKSRVLGVRGSFRIYRALVLDLLFEASTHYNGQK